MSGLYFRMISLLVTVSWLSMLLDAHPNVYYVKPTEDTPCPITKQCSSLAQIAIQVDFAIDSISNTTVHFLPGTHIIGDAQQRFFTISNAKHIVISGSTNNSDVSTIDCMGQTGFAFVNVTNLTITYLKFWQCQAHWSPYELTSKMAPYVNVTLTRTLLGRNGDPTDYKSAALFFLQVVDLNITQISLALNERGNVCGIGLLGINIFGNSTISESVFANHRSNSSDFLPSHPNGGNCIIMYTNPPTSSTIAPRVVRPTSEPLPVLASLNISKCSFTGGWSFYYNSGGLTIFLLQYRFKVIVNIDDVTTRKNGVVGDPGANMHIHDCGCTPSLVSMNNFVSTNGMGTAYSLFSYRRFPFCSFDLERPCILIREVALRVTNSKFTSANSKAIPVGIWATWPACSVRISSIIIENSVIANNTNSVLTSIGLVVSSSLAVLLKNVSFYNNSIYGNQQVNVYSGTVLRIVDCHFSNNRGTPIVSVGPSLVITFQGNVTFEDNVGYNGGALYLDLVRVEFEHPLHLQFINNHAVNKGGAIYVTQPSSCTEQCFFAIPEGPRDIVIKGWNNTAGIAGSFLYGGFFAKCKRQEPNASLQIIANKSDLSPISSDPILVCICQNGRPNCSIKFECITAYPGQKFMVSVAIVGQREGIVPGTVYSHITPPESGAVLKDLQSAQEARRECITATFSIFSSSSQEMIRLDVDPLDPDQTRVQSRYLRTVNRETEGLCYNRLVQVDLPLLVNTTLLPCPLGFELSDYPFECTCASELTNQGINCSIQTQTVYRTAQIWINATHSENGTNLIIVHKHCPLHYCKPEEIILNLSSPDDQCSFNRSGILCGKCQQNLSLVLGTSRCQKCTNTFLCLLFPFILAGFALVFLLISLNLTVAVGTINGLLFYGNILQMNYTTFFSHANQSSMNQILTIFIAWLNLDLGIETCFYNGLDTYAMTWLQFVFPVYVWSIVILIIVSSHYSTFAARLSGRNAVPVLATLFLMSYTKLQRTVITVLSFTLLSLPDGSKRAVWLYDANVDYLSAIHTPLFLAAVATLICLTIPYTVMLLFAQCLQMRTNHRCLFWVIKLKPVFDAYTGPYKDKCRHWTGLLLLLRTVLFLTFASNVLGDPAINLLAIAVSMSLLMVYGWNIGSVYRKRGLDLLEHSFFLNLGVLSVATLYTNSASVNQSAAVYISATIAMVTFVGIVIYHTYIQIKTSKRSFRRCFEKLSNIKWMLLHCSRKPVQPSATHLLAPHGSHDSDDDSPGEESSHEPTVTVIDVTALREPLLEDL